MALSTIPTRALSEQGINFRNLIINGDMSIAQRGTSFSFNGSSGYTVDRFNFTQTSGATGDCTITQEADAPSNTGLVKSVKIAVDTAETPTGSGNCVFQQNIEGFNCAPLEHGQSSPPSATLSFWVKSNKTGTYSVQIKGEGSTGRYVLFDYTISSANTWEKKIITWVGDTSVALDYDSSRRLRVIWHLSSGPDDKVSPTSSWATSSLYQMSSNAVNFFDSASNEIYFTGVQLEVGTSASDFEFLPYDVNLQRCKRYLQYVCGNSNIGELTGGFRATGSAQCGMQFTTPMRTAPSVSLVGLRLHDLNDGDNLDVTSIGVVNGSSSNGTWLNMNNSGTGTVAGVCILYGYNASPTAGVQSYGIKVDAEL